MATAPTELGALRPTYVLTAGRKGTLSHVAQARRYKMLSVAKQTTTGEHLSSYLILSLPFRYPFVNYSSCTSYDV